MKVFIFKSQNNLFNYTSAIKKCGFTPILSNNLQYAKCADALLLTGGGDITPYFYGKKPFDLKRNSPLVDIAEFYLLNEFVENKKPVVGVCKGMQIINVYFGGKLSLICKKNLKNHYPNNSINDVYHLINVSPNSLLKQICFNSFCVTSYHHEKISLLGRSLKVTAKSLDGVIESVEHKTLKILGVQFHPERMGADFSKRFFSTALLR